MTTIAVLARTSTGIPLAGLAPTWVVYYNAATGAAATQPAITALGGGSYKFTIEDLATNPAPVGIMDLGGVSVPRYLIFAGESSYVGFAAWDENGAPLAGLVPTWSSLYNVDTGAAYAQPAITELGGGLYKTARVAVHASGAIDLGATAWPRVFHYDTEQIAGLGGGTAPTIAVVSPDVSPDVPGDPGAFSSDAATAALTPIVIDIDSSSTIAYANVAHRTPSARDETVVYARGSFRGSWAVRSWSELIGTKVRLHILPEFGWPVGAPSTVTLDVDAVAGDGTNITSTR